MANTSSKGVCNFCKGEFGKGAMTRHLANCKQREAAPVAGNGRQKVQPARLFHLLVEGRRLKEYWLHLELPATATLEDLDRFLRDIWLECCGHLSAFEIAGQSYASSVEFGFDDFDDRPMKGVKLEKVLAPGMTFHGNGGTAGRG
jgi:hypothetical protein